MAIKGKQDPKFTKRLLKYWKLDSSEKVKKNKKVKITIGKFDRNYKE